MSTKWFNIQTGCGGKRCFNQRDVKNFALNNWKDQVPTCAGGKAKGSCNVNCQNCTTLQGCSGQQCPALSDVNPYYKLGPKISVRGVGDMATQPYTFPLPLNYGDPGPPINTNIFIWARVP